MFVTLLHLVALVMSYFIFRQNKVLFIVSEVFIIISAVIAWQLYNQLIQPLKLLLQGVEAIRDRDFNVKFIETGKYEMDQLIKVYNGMIEQLRTERTRQEQQHFFLEKLIHTSPTGIIILDYDDQIKQVNPQALVLLGLIEKTLLDKPISALDNPLLQSVQTLSSGKSTIVTLNGVNTYKLQKSHFIDRGFARHFVMIEELTTEILAAEKKAYGKVIRMMAHEVNNTIGPVNSILQSAINRQELWQHQVSMQPLRNALQVAFDRNQNLNIFMRNFAEVVRLPEPNKKDIDLIVLVHNAAALFQQKAVETNIRFQWQEPRTPVIIWADEQQLEQVLINIIKNAVEAIGTDGVISFIITNLPAQLVIADTGKGLSTDSAAQLFSPFFSTKKEGQGIGLTLTREILHNHGFNFSLQSYGPADTRFAVKF